MTIRLDTSSNPAIIGLDENGKVKWRIDKDGLSLEEFDKLKAEVEEMKILLRRAIEYDKADQSARVRG